MDNTISTSENCSFREGALEPCAPLAVALVPRQTSCEPHYNSNQALQRGTLFPGLDLPFMNVVNKGELDGTPLGEIMALDFVCAELNLYLDTHKQDQQAFELLKSMLNLYSEAKSRYIKTYGPICIDDLRYSHEYNWLCDPWPWDYQDKEEG